MEHGFEKMHIGLLLRWGFSGSPLFFVFSISRSPHLKNFNTNPCDSFFWKPGCARFVLLTQLCVRTFGACHVIWQSRPKLFERLLEVLLFPAD